MLERLFISRWVAVAGLAMACLPAFAGESNMTLTVSGAASLRNVFMALAPGFESQHSGVRLVFNFAASDAVLAQVKNGAPVDVLATADQETMNRAQDLHLLQPGSRRSFAGNKLVLIVPMRGARHLSQLAGLKDAAIQHIALGQPSGVPAGRYAKAALEAADLWSAVEGKFVFALNVRQVLDYVARGEVDAGFVYASDARVAADKVRVAMMVPTEQAIAYSVAVVAGTARDELAQQFVAYLLSPAAQAVLLQSGFESP